MQYKTISAPAKMVVKHEKDMDKAVASYGNIINQEASNGWELHSIVSIPVEVKGGCFSLFKKDYTIIHNMLIFKKN